MKISDAYLQFVNQVNRNATNNNLSVDKPRFIMLFNDIQNRYVEWILEKRNEDQIRYVSPLLTPHKQLDKVGTKTEYDEFELPSDYFDLSNMHVFASNGSCSDVRLKTWEIKNEDYEELFFDENNTPSLKARETFFHTANQKVLVYKKDFTVQKALLSYYRQPVQVDIEGYKRSDGTQSQDVDPELEDKAVGRILVAMNKEFSSISKDPNQYRIDNDRLFSPI